MMSMFYDGLGIGWSGMFFMMLLPLALLGIIIYWTINNGKHKGNKM